MDLTAKYKTLRKNIRKNIQSKARQRALKIKAMRGNIHKLDLLKTKNFCPE